MSPIGDTARAVAVEPRLHRIKQILIAKWLGQNSTAPPFMARTVIGMSPYPVMKMIGIALASSS